MKLLLFLFLLITNITSAQSNNDTVFMRYNKDWSADSIVYISDTIIFESGIRRNMLIGTTLLPMTYNQMETIEYGLIFNKLEKSDCQSHEAEEGGENLEHVNSILITDTTLKVDINITGNCCHDFLCDYTIDENGILKLFDTGYGTYCSCSCCFGLTYYFNLEKEKDSPPIKGIMIGNNEKTFKKIN